MNEIAIGELLPRTPETTPRQSGGGAGFGEVLGDLLTRVGADQIEAEKKAAELVSGDGDIVDTMIAMNRAELSMRFVVNLRNRAVEAYHEIMRLQV